MLRGPLGCRISSSKPVTVNNCTHTDGRNIFKMSLINVYIKWSLLASIHLAVRGCVDVMASRGRFLMSGDHSACTFLLNGHQLNGSTLQSVRAYGVLQISCQDCVFTRLSRFEGCNDCLMCSHNEGIESCRSVMVPVTLAVVLNLISVMMLWLIISCVDRHANLVDRMLQKIEEWRMKRTGKREEKHVLRVRRILLSEVSAPIKVQSSAEEDSYPTPKEERRRRSSSPTDPRLKGSVSGALLLALGLSSTKACDDVYFLSSQGIIYEDMHMQHVSNGLALLHTGSSLCFKLSDGSQEELALLNMVAVESYGAKYRTCDFSVEVRSHSTCLGSGLCWSSDSCRSGVRLQAVGPKAYKLPESQMGCRLVPNLSEMSCVHMQSCVWYYWDLLINKDKCDVIYEHLHTNLILHMRHTDRRGNQIPFALSVTAPSISSPISVHLVNTNHEFSYAPKNVRQHHDLFFGVSACSLNQGIPGVLGDLQLPLISGKDSANWSYPIHAVSCHPDGASLSCTTPTPGYQSTLRMDSRNIIDVNKVSKGRLLTFHKPVRGYASLMLKSDVIESQTNESASCDVKVESSYGCSACHELPTVFVSTPSVLKTGILPFTSNCSFYLYEVSCSQQIQALQLLDRYDVCEMKFKGSNQSLVFNLEYQFKGKIYERGIMTHRSQETFSDKINLAQQSPDFLNSLQISLGIGLVTTFIISILKMVSRYLAFRAGKLELDKITD